MTADRRFPPPRSIEERSRECLRRPGTRSAKGSFCVPICPFGTVTGGRQIQANARKIRARPLESVSKVMRHERSGARAA